MTGRAEATADPTCVINRVEGPSVASPFNATAALAVAREHLMDARCAIGERRRQSLLFARFALDDAREATNGGDLRDEIARVAAMMEALFLISETSNRVGAIDRRR